MAKMAKAKYTYVEKDYTAKELVELLKKQKKVKWVKQLKLYCSEVEVEYKSKPIKLYFCKTTKRGKWHLLVSSNTKLGILKAYEIYSAGKKTTLFKDSLKYCV